MFIKLQSRITGKFETNEMVHLGQYQSMALGSNDYVFV